MKDDHLVSVLMPAFNAEKFIAEAIKSILNQKYSNWELLILDDASTDSTAAIIGSFQDKRIKVFSHTENRGYLDSCNELFHKARGTFITFLDADDYCIPNRLSSCFEQFELNQKLDFLTTDYVRISETGELVSENHVSIDYGRYATDPKYYPTICCATIFLRKELLAKVGGYRPLFKEIGGEDYYWVWELSRAGIGHHLPELLYHYRFHPTQASVAHKKDLSLFLPELIEQLKIAFQEVQWEEPKAEMISKNVRELYVQSPFQLHLRKAQQSINRPEVPFWNHAVKCFIQVRKHEELTSFVYLIYSWGAKRIKSAAQ